MVHGQQVGLTHSNLIIHRLTHTVELLQVNVGGLPAVVYLLVLTTIAGL